MEKKLIEYRTGCCLRRTLAAGRDSEDRCWGTMKMNDETVKGLLRKAGLKVTNQRMMVLDIIASHPAEHLTAEEIYDLAKVLTCSQDLDARLYDRQGFLVQFLKILHCSFKHVFSFLCHIFHLLSFVSLFKWIDTPPDLFTYR